MKSIEDPKFQTIVQKTAKVIFAMDKKILSFLTNKVFETWNS